MKARRISKKTSAPRETPEVGRESQVDHPLLPQGLNPDQNAGSEREEAGDSVTPLEYMLAVMRDPAVEPERRDEMAKLALPYMHPKVSVPEPAGAEPASPDGNEASATDIARRIAFALANAAQAERGQR